MCAEQKIDIGQFVLATCTCTRFSNIDDAYDDDDDDGKSGVGIGPIWPI